MPKNVRNFWIVGTADDKARPVAFGPVRKDGGFRLTVKQHSNGEIMLPLSVWGVALDDGTISLHVELHENNWEKVSETHHTFRTERKKQ